MTVRDRIVDFLRANPGPFMQCELAEKVDAPAPTVRREMQILQTLGTVVYVDSEGVAIDKNNGNIPRYGLAPEPEVAQSVEDMTTAPAHADEIPFGESL
jgi:hypothetical protein